jgi:hypothetical protein
MAKRKPLPCTAANCGDNYLRCGKARTYSTYKCRCDACFEAKSEAAKRHYAKNSEKIIQSVKRYRAENPEVVAASGKRWREANPEKVTENNKRYAAENSAAAVERARQWKLANWTQSEPLIWQHVLRLESTRII